MRLSELLRPEGVCLGVRNLDKWRVIEDLTRQLVGAGCLPEGQRPAVHQALVQRERSMSTGMENGVAIPHCSMEEVEDPLVALGISREGIDFESIDGLPTHLILLLVTPKNKTKVHIRTLAEIAKLLSDAAFRQQLVGAESRDQVCQMIRDQEASRGAT